jgi:hypothetical protein
MTDHTPQPPDDLDAELAELLRRHHDAEPDARAHIKRCECCQAVSVMIAGLRADLWAIAEGRVR